MSDIGLLMTSILAMGQKVSSTLPQQLLNQHENYLFKTDSKHLSNISAPDAALQITPPEFTQFGDKSSTVVLSHNPIIKNILSNILAKVGSEKLVNDSEPKQLSLELPTEVLADAPDSAKAMANPRVSNNTLPRVEFGNSGLRVRVVQKLLISSGYIIEVDGFFGALTEAAVKAFQYQRNLVVDGIVGQNTWRELTK
jgi:murein L,D-transpeptidase YcbB/YkuD